MTRSVLGLALLSTALLSGCAGADPGCAEDDPSCFTHSQSAQNSTGATTGSSNEGTQGSLTSTTGGTTTGGTTTTTTSTTTTTTTGAATGGTTTGGTTTGGSTATITKTLMVDDFANQSTFNAGYNSLSQYQGDNQTMAVYALASNNRMELQCNVTGCYWWSLLAAQGTCLDLSPYTHIALTVQGAPGADAAFQLQNNSSDCASTTFTAAQNVDLATYTSFDNNPHTIYIPLSAFNSIDRVHSRAIAVVNLTLNTPIYLSNIKLVTVTVTK